MFQDNNIPIEDAPTNHRVTRHTQRKRVPCRFEPDTFNVHRNATFGVLFTGLGWTSRDGAKQRNVSDSVSELRQRGRDAQRPRLAGVGFDETLAFERIQMGRSRPVTGKTKSLRYFPERGNWPARLQFCLDKFQHTTLRFG